MIRNRWVEINKDKEVRVKSEIELGSFETNMGLMLKDRNNRFKEKPALQTKEDFYDLDSPYQTTSWQEFYSDIARIGASLCQMGVKKGDKIAILSKNRKEMLILELAVMSIGAISVPIFAGYPALQINYILNHSEAKLMVVGDRPLFRSFMQIEFKYLEKVFLIDYLPVDGSPIEIVDFKELYSFGNIPIAQQLEIFETQSKTIEPDDPCLMMYTSGTTKMPKGVVLCHRNILSQQKALDILWDIDSQDRFLSYLPWHHSFGGIFERFCAISSGALLTIDNSYGKDLSRLIKNFKQIKPTVYFSVPRIYQALVAEAQGSEELEKEIIHPELKFVFTAAAPLPENVSDYFADRKIPVVEGWGLTETSPCCTLTSKSGNRHSGYVGFPIPGVELGLSEENEILVKGPNVMKGYYKYKGKEVFDKNGWFHTGDMGEITSKGLKLNGRIDGIFKLSNAEKVYTHSIETALVDRCEFIDSAVVCGSGRDFVSTLIVPNFVKLEKWAKQRNVDFSNRTELLAYGSVRTLFKNQIDMTNEMITPKYARVKAAIIIPRDLTIEKQELTPSMKVIRLKVLQNFSSEIAVVYNIREKEKVGKIPDDQLLVDLGVILID